MEAVLSWVKQIFILSILSTVVTHLMPSAKYTKYASYICGLPDCHGEIYSRLRQFFTEAFHR